jgi:hypothetical protein
MKRIVISLVLLLSVSGFSAPIDFVTSSALMPGDSVSYNLDFIDPFGLPIFDITINSRIGNSGTDQTTVLNHIPDSPYYINTYEGTEYYQNLTGDIEFYGRIVADTAVLTQSYKNSSNQFPPSPILYADLANDPVGDTAAGTPGEWLDLTGSSITYSDDRIFGRLKNAGGGWPTSEGFTYYAYAFFLYNPDNPTLTATAMVYVNVPFFFTPGLYTVNLEDTTFSQIAEIDYQTDGEYLHLSCAVSDLLSDPNWDTWPPVSGFAITGGMTLAVINLQPTLADFSYLSGFVPETQFLSVSSNSAPVALSFDIEIDEPVSLTPHFDYDDSDNNLPVQKSIIFNGEPLEMGSFDHSYNDGSIFETVIPWPGEGWHTYYFVFSDGAETILTTIDSIYLNPSSVPDDHLPSNFTLLQNYPNPFNALTTLEFKLENEAQISIDIFDIRGRLINRLINSPLESGRHSIVWNSSDEQGNIVSSGIYYYRLSDGINTVIQKMTLLK